jgi:hypothetical protein
MKKIKLTQGKYTTVDDEDFVSLNKYKWYATKKFKTYYAVRSLKNGSKIQMHRVILNTPENMETDHVDGDGLNNQKNNLRACTHSENQSNKSKYVNNTTGYKGLSWCERNKKWLVRISVNKKRFYLGHFKSKKEASEVYNIACLKKHGKFAKI